MLNPEVGRQYWFVHPNSPHIRHTPESAAAAAAVATPVPAIDLSDERMEFTYIQSFIRYEDGSAGALDLIYAGAANPDAWVSALDHLYENGYYEIDEARAAGLLPPDWEVPSEFSILDERAPVMVRTQKDREHWRRCRRIAQAGPICPHCGGSDQIRVLPSYFICNTCALSFGHGNLQAIQTRRPVDPVEPVEPIDLSVTA
jgi:ribosomal protein L37AE/L43A